MKRTYLCACIALAATGTSHSATTLYSSNTDFGVVTGGTGNDLSVVGWEGVYGKPETTAQNATDAPAATGSFKIGVFDGTNGSVTDYLYFQQSGGVTGMDYFAHTFTGSNFSPFSPDSYAAGLSATWTKSSGDAYGSYYSAVLVDGTWYSATTVNGSSGSPTFNFLTASWVTIADGTGAPLERGSTPTTSAALFAGNTIDGFGFFAEDLTDSVTTSRTLRLDNITITGVPEPTSAILGLCGAALLLRRRR